jgi:hypothetical protein
LIGIKEWQVTKLAAVLQGRYFDITAQKLILLCSLYLIGGFKLGKFNIFPSLSFRISGAECRTFRTRGTKQAY